MPNLTYLSHSAWMIKNQGFTVAIDPFLEGNPTAPLKPEDLHANYIIVTHAHGDNIGESIPMAKAFSSLMASLKPVIKITGMSGLMSINLRAS